MEKFNVGDKVLVKGRGTRVYTVQNVNDRFYGLVSEDYVPDPKASAIEIAVKHDEVVSVFAVPSGPAESTPTASPVTDSKEF